MIAYCDANGRIGYARARTPEGMLFIARGGSRVLRGAIARRARMGHTPGVELVPGIPEADTTAEKLAALSRFIVSLPRVPGLTVPRVSGSTKPGGPKP